MSALVRNLTAYAAYHRDKRNIALHMLGIPLIVLALETLLSRPFFALGSTAFTPAMAASALATLYYFTLDARFAVVLAVLLALAAWAGLVLGRLPTAVWLGSGVGAFVVGWAVQFIGHAFEGRKPAFFDDLISLMTGPLFVTAEFGFLLGLRLKLKRAIEGPQGGRAGNPP